MVADAEQEFVRLQTQNEQMLKWLTGFPKKVDDAAVKAGAVTFPSRVGDDWCGRCRGGRLRQWGLTQKRCERRRGMTGAAVAEVGDHAGTPTARSVKPPNRMGDTGN
jgi:hypothetical protein